MEPGDECSFQIPYLITRKIDFVDRLIIKVNIKDGENYAYLSGGGKLDLQIDQETMNHLIQGNKHIFLKFMDILFNALDKFIQMGPSEQKMQITELHNLKIQQILSQYTITDRAKETENLNQLTKSEQNEYALQLSQPIQKSQFKFVKGQCQSCQMYQQKIKLLEGEIELLKKQLDKK